MATATDRKYYLGETISAAEIQDRGNAYLDAICEGLLKIEGAAGENLASAARPCALVVSYVVGETYPWRLADDWCEETYETVGKACDAARAWYEGNQ